MSRSSVSDHLTSAQVRALQQVTAALVSVLEPDQVMDVILTQGMDVLEADQGAIVLEDGSGRLQLKRAVNYSAEAQQLFASLPLDSTLPAVTAFRSGEPQWVNNVPFEAQDNPDLQAFYQLMGSRSGVALPLNSGTLRGVLCLTFLPEHPLMPDERAFLLTLADQCALALERALLSDRLLLDEARFRAIFEASPVGVALLRQADLTFMKANPALLALLRATWDQVVGHTAQALGLWPAGDPVSALPEGGERLTLLRSLDGLEFDVAVTLRPVEAAGLQCIVLMVQDLSELTAQAAQVQALGHRVSELAHHDPLTQLPNRLLLTGALETLLAGRGVVALLHLKFSGFTRINGALEFMLRDAALITVAEQLRPLTPPGGLAARVDGSLFALAFVCHNELEAERWAQQVLQQLNQPVSVQGFEVHLQVRAGLACGTGEELAVDDLTTASLEALAETNQSALLQRYRPELAGQAQARLALQSELRGAIRTPGALSVAWQPIIDLGTGRVVSAEALVRWQHPQRGEVLPGAFLDVAEATGMIVEIGWQVLEAACRQAAQWWAAGLQVQVQVNLAAAQVVGGDLVDRVQAALTQTALEPRALVLELSERDALTTLNGARDQLDRLRRLGVQLAVDDFGTGQANLLTLATLPVDQLKIDRAFVAGLGSSPQAGALMESMLLLARRLGLTVVAEGVETAAQLELLQQLGCTRIQGFYLARPLSPEAFVAFAGQPVLEPAAAEVQEGNPVQGK